MERLKSCYFFNIINLIFLNYNGEIKELLISKPLNFMN